MPVETRTVARRETHRLSLPPNHVVSAFGSGWLFYGDGLGSRLRLRAERQVLGPYAERATVDMQALAQIDFQVFDLANLALSDMGLLLNVAPGTRAWAMNGDLRVEMWFDGAQWKPAQKGDAEPVRSDWAADSGPAEIVNRPNLATVATTGSYSDLTDKPTIPAAQVQADWNATSGPAQVLNKPEIPTVPPLSTVALTGSYADLTNKPAIPEPPALAMVAYTGHYTDLDGLPAIPAAQQPADWAASAGPTRVLNKPTIPDAQVPADWNATTGAARILNKPTIPAALVVGHGAIATPLLVLGAQQDVVVTLDRTMPNNTYEVKILPATNILGGAQLTVKSKTTTTVTITVRALLALAAGSINVLAFAT